MKLVSFITDPSIIYKILEHLGLCNQKSSRSPPAVSKNESVIEIVYEPILDDWPAYEGPCIQIN